MALKYFETATAYTAADPKESDICFVAEEGAVYTHGDKFGGGNETYIETTYSNLKSLRDNGQLIPGATYRITDYVATTTQADTRSASHPFDIITLALSPNTLSEECRAAKHVGDGYFNVCKVNAWRIWYRLDNDSGSFTWADTTNGKGVVYRMIDEYGNDMPYDFKGIQFKRYKIATVTNSAMANLVGLPIGTTNGYGYTVDTSVSKWYYTFSRMGNTWDDDVVDAGSFNSYTTDMVFDTLNMTDSNNNLPALMNNVFAYGPIVHVFLCNEEGVTPSYHPLTYFVRCHFEGTDSRDNTFIGWTGLVNARDTFRRNLIVGSFRHIDVGTNFQDNTFFNFNDCSFSYFGEGCTNNLLYSKITQNVDFGNLFRQNSITADCIYHSEFAGYVARNTFTNIYFGSVKIKGQLLDCTFTGRFMACSFSPICGYCDFKGGTGSNYVVNLDVVGGVRGTASARVNVENTTDFIAANAQGTQRRIRLEGDTNGNMVISWYSNGKHIIKTKGATGSTWTILPSYEDYDDGQNVANETLYNGNYYFTVDPSKRLNIFRLSGTNRNAVYLRMDPSATASDFHKEYHVLIKMDDNNAYSDKFRLHSAWANTVMAEAGDGVYIDSKHVFDGNSSSKYYELDLHGADGECYAELNILCEQTSTVKAGYTGAYRNWYVRTDGIYGSVEEEAM